MKTKIKKCIKCGIQLHPTDWIILKQMSKMPICDSCLFIENGEKKKVSILKK
jgi:hypothetical protein